MSIGDKIIIKYNGDMVSFGQVYDGMTGYISSYSSNNKYRIILDEKSRRKINEINRINTDYTLTVQPFIPFRYVFVYDKNLELE